MEPADKSRSSMFDAQVTPDGRVVLSGRCHAGDVERLREVLAGVEHACEVDFTNLDYISSAGLGVLLATQKRLGASGEGLTLVNLNAHIGEVFRIAGFDKVFEIK
jgi:anti-sigma B factor antagonist